MDVDECHHRHDRLHGARVPHQWSRLGQDRRLQLRRGQCYKLSAYMCPNKKYMYAPCSFYRANGRDAMPAMLARNVVVVCLSVRPSVTRRYCTKTAKHWSTETALYDSSRSLVFCRQRSRRISTGLPPTWAPKRDQVSYNRRFSTNYYLAISQKRCKIWTQLLWNTNRNSYMLQGLGKVQQSTPSHPFLPPSFPYLPLSSLLCSVIIGTIQEAFANWFI